MKHKSLYESYSRESNIFVALMKESEMKNFQQHLLNNPLEGTFLLIVRKELLEVPWNTKQNNGFFNTWIKMAVIGSE